MVQVLQHLGDLESFCTRVQVVLQEQERRKFDSSASKSKRSFTTDSVEFDDIEADESASEESLRTRQELRPVAVVKSSAVAAAANEKGSPASPAIAFPDIRDDEDFYFGGDPDLPIESNVLRSQMKNSGAIREKVAQVMFLQVILQLLAPNNSIFWTLFFISYFFVKMRS
jgi:hypothetical protein